MVNLMYIKYPLDFKLLKYTPRHPVHQFSHFRCVTVGDAQFLTCYTEALRKRHKNGGSKAKHLKHGVNKMSPAFLRLSDSSQCDCCPDLSGQLSQFSLLRGYKDRLSDHHIALCLPCQCPCLTDKFSVQLGQNIVIVEDNQSLQFTTITNDNAMGARNYEVGKPLAPLSSESCNN
jgi:hypothetical protein